MRFWLAVPLIVSLGACGGTIGAGSDAGAGSGGGTVGGQGGGEAGSRGSGGSAGGQGGTVATDACGVAIVPAVKLASSTLGAKQGDYDGPAIVERSTTQDLILYFQPASGAGATAAAHATITSVTAVPSAPTRFDPMPIFPVGAKVWLTKSPAAEPTTIYPRPWSIVVRDRQGGTLLFGAVRNTEPPLTSPVVLSGVTDDCVAMGADLCTRNATVTHQTVAIQGDTAVTVRDGETAVVTIGGIAYDVSVLAQRSSPGTSQSCADYYSPFGVSLDVWARDLASLIARLEVGALPACVMGNEPDQSASVSLYGDIRAPVELPISYLSRGQFYPDEFLFSAPTVTGDPTMASAGLHAPGIFLEPAVGQAFWVSAPEESVKVIRRSQTTPAIIGYFGYSAASRSNIERVMGTTVTAESCQYAFADPATGAGPSSVWEVLFGTPAVRVKTGSRGAIQIAGRNYDVWVDPYAGSMPFVSFVER